MTVEQYYAAKKLEVKYRTYNSFRDMLLRDYEDNVLRCERFKNLSSEIKLTDGIRRALLGAINDEITDTLEQIDRTLGMDQDWFLEHPGICATDRLHKASYYVERFENLTTVLNALRSYMDAPICVPQPKIVMGGGCVELRRGVQLTRIYDAMEEELADVVKNLSEI